MELKPFGIQYRLTVKRTSSAQNNGHLVNNATSSKNHRRQPHFRSHLILNAIKHKLHIPFRKFPKKNKSFSSREK